MNRINGETAAAQGQGSTLFRISKQVLPVVYESEARASRDKANNKVLLRLFCYLNKVEIRFYCLPFYLALGVCDMTRAYAIRPYLCTSLLYYLRRGVSPTPNGIRFRAASRPNRVMHRCTKTLFPPYFKNKTTLVAQNGAYINLITLLIR
jgi:hypothetical protein